MNTAAKESDIIGALYNTRFCLHDTYLVLLRLQGDYRFDPHARQAVALLTREDRHLSEVWHYTLTELEAIEAKITEIAFDLDNPVPEQSPAEDAL
jgi:hypothetical protein